tara:strand:- start:20680 stop:22236 length:1557 start_codon:yes stop_codon:yes gene_type:complete
MGKSKSSGGSELDPAIRAMMQETFDVGKGTIMEEYDTGRFTQYGQPIMGQRLKEYQEYGDPRFATPSATTLRGEGLAANYLTGADGKLEGQRLNNIYDDMYASSSYSPLDVSARDVASRDVASRDVAAGLIDPAANINAYDFSSRDVGGERVADPNDITAREILERSIDFERVNAETYNPNTLAGTDLSPYTNQYNQQVKDVTLNDIVTQRDRQLSDLQSRAAQAGAFGGTRQAVEAGLINNNAMGQYAKQSALLNKEGFDTANQLAMQDIGLLNQGGLTNIQNRMTAGQLNQSADLTAGQANLNAAMETQRLNQARDLSLGQFNTQAMQDAAMANQSNERAIQLDNAARNLQMQGMSADDAYRVAQSNVDNTFRQQSTNVANTLNADLANQDSSLRADLANQDSSLRASLANQGADLTSSQANAQFGLDANAQNQQGLLSSASLAGGVTDANMARFGALTDIGDRQTARTQQELDFDYQQFLEGEEYQMQLAQFLGGLLSGFPTPLKSQNKSSTLSF